MHVTHCDRQASVFLVEELEPVEGWLQGSFRVRLTAGTCDCGFFQSLHFSCCHALASCAIGSYVHPIYMQQAVFKVYKSDFLPIANEKLWPEWYGTRLRPNPAMRRKCTGRPISTKFCN
ncbi:hypothetical protein Ahy_A02g008210 [Arachis hypogaea]|uniref:SWIM-type domain-containing protein n=1 Tax=Arachis hypogaea TaxID=3818 RepID=A0A445EDY4_ARAHY|nr:hypothetical protein Ahy_A02g008210 [Arachis hypogaea]